MLPVSVTTSMVVARPAQLPEPQQHHLQGATGGHLILCFLFLNKASFPTVWPDSLEAGTLNVAVPAAHHPAKTASSHAAPVAMLGQWGPSVHRDVLQKMPSQALLQWEGHGSQAQLFPGSLKAGRMPKQVQFMASHQCRPSAVRVLPLPESTQGPVNGSSLAKEKLFLPGMYSYPVQGQAEVPEVSLMLSAASTMLGNSLAGGQSLPALPHLRPSPPLACLFCLQRGSTPYVIPL